MKIFESLTSRKIVFTGALILSAIIIYPNIGDFIWRLCAPAGSRFHMDFTVPMVVYFIYRYLFFVGLTWILLRINIKRVHTLLKARFGYSFLITAAAYALYVVIGLSVSHIIRLDCFTQLPILQFLIAWLMTVLVGYIYSLTVTQRETEKEMERLRSENLQSRVEALSNQINPHFFFNSLNGLTALVAAQRNGETMEYVTKLSTIFRYILQSEKRGLVRLEEELEFLDAYRYLLEIRYGGKITFKVDISGADRAMRLPVLSLLPLVENVVKHNVIDSEHPMTVDLAVPEHTALAVTNPVHTKYQVEGCNGIGLSNLSARYKLLMETDIRVRREGTLFTVILPLKCIEDESIAGGR